MCVNPFKAPKIPEPAKLPTPAPAQPIEEAQLAPETFSNDAERDGLKSRRTGREALRIPLNTPTPGGTGLTIPRG